MKTAASGNFRTALAGAAAACTLATMTGCLQRTISVTSEPPGALVWINDTEVGRTPVDVDFTYFGKYSVRLRREGYEPVVDVRKVNKPVHEWPGIDIVTEAAPTNIHHRVRWHYDLEPALEYRVSSAEAESELIHSGMQMRKQLRGYDDTAAPR